MLVILFKGILQGVYWGLGTGGGTIVGGYVSHVFGFRSTFRGFAVVTGVVLVVFLTTQLITKYTEILPQEDRNEEMADEESNDDDDDDDDDDEMFLSPVAPDQKSHSQDDIAEETWGTEWKTPPADQHSQSSYPTESAQAGNLSQPGKLSNPAESIEPPQLSQPAQSAEPVKLSPPGEDPGELDNIQEKELSEDTTKLIDES